jgi:hypothetical protein
VNGVDGVGLRKGNGLGHDAAIDEGRASGTFMFSFTFVFRSTLIFSYTFRRLPPLVHASLYDRTGFERGE